MEDFPLGNTEHGDHDRRQKMDSDRISRKSYQEDTGIFGDLADHEDHQGNLRRELKRIFHGINGLVLLEAGAGLG